MLMIALAIGLLPSLAQSQIKGYMFGEYYSVLKHHDANIDGKHGFWFRRIYFTYNGQLTEKIKMRLRLEMNSPGDFTSSSTLTAYVKDAYLSAKLGSHDLMFGIVSTPTFGFNLENHWGYRHLEKTPLDLYKMASSRDFGIGLKGNLDKKKMVSYFLFLGNGSSNKGETDSNKKVYGALAFKPVEGLIIEVYGDYEPKPNDRTYFTYQGFAGYGGEWGRIGIQYARRHYSEQVAVPGPDIDRDYDVFSGFAVIKAGSSVELVARYDKAFGTGFEQNFNGSGISYVPFADDNPFSLIIGGISWNVAENFWIIPNVKYVFYDEPAAPAIKPDDNVYANLSFFFKF
jgi:hypothetical protein